MKVWQRLLALFCVLLAIAMTSPAQITISSSEFSSYFNVGQPIQFLVDTTIFSVETPMVYVGQKGGPNVYDFSGATLVEFGTDTLYSVSEDPFLSQRFAPELFTLEFPHSGEEGDGTEQPIISVSSDWFGTVGQYRFWTADSVRIRHDSPGEPLAYFPITYGDSTLVEITRAETTYVSGSPVETQNSEDTVSVVVDGWGTLKLPGGKEFPVLRIRDTREGDVDSMNYGGKEFRFFTQGGGMLFVSARYSDAPDTGWVEVGDPIQYIINPTITSSEIPGELPTGFELAQNYPNPFNPSTTIRYSLPVGAKVRLTVYSILGQELAVLDEGEKSAGWHTIRWNAVSQPSGVYFVRLQAGSFVSTRKVVLLK